MTITFTVNSANDFFLNLNNSRLNVFAKITKEDKTNINEKKPNKINLMLHSMFCKIEYE